MNWLSLFQDEAAVRQPNQAQGVSNQVIYLDTHEASKPAFSPSGEGQESSEESRPSVSLSGQTAIQ